MTAGNKRQMDGFIKKMKKAALKAAFKEEQAEIYGFWTGFLSAMKLSGCISAEEYRFYYDDMLSFCKNGRLKNEVRREEEYACSGSL